MFLAQFYKFLNFDFHIFKKLPTTFSAKSISGSLANFKKFFYSAEPLQSEPTILLFACYALKARSVLTCSYSYNLCIKTLPNTLL